MLYAGGELVTESVCDRCSSLRLVGHFGRANIIIHRKATLNNIKPTWPRMLTALSTNVYRPVEYSTVQYSTTWYTLYGKRTNRRKLD